MCGLCLPHCPTYVKTQNEAESPRGRISLILALANGQLEADDKLRGHLDSCLLCRACESKCPSGVQFGEIMDGARHALGPSQAATIKEQRIKLDKLALDEKHRSNQAKLLWLANKTGARAVGRWLGLTQAIGLTRFEQLAPNKLNRPHKWQDYYPANNAHQGDVALFTGCFGDMFDQATLDNSIQLLNACGFGVYIPLQQVCCGALHQHQGDRSQAQQLAKQNLAAFEKLDIQAVISCASGCGSHLSEYKKTIGHELPIQDISQFLSKTAALSKLKFTPLDKQIAVHEPCSLRNVLKQQTPPYVLLSHIPELKTTSLANNAQCCGAAGSYMLDHPEMADQLRADKLTAIELAEPDILVSSNIGCALHLAAGLKQTSKTLEVIHPITLLARQLVD